MSILQATELKKYYGTEPNITRALDGVTLSIEKGEFVAIVGTSGSGKSTLLNMIGGLDVPTSGQVVVDGKELSKLKDEERRPRPAEKSCSRASPRKQLFPRVAYSFHEGCRFSLKATALAAMTCSSGPPC